MVRISVALVGGLISFTIFGCDPRPVALPSRDAMPQGYAMSQGPTYDVVVDFAALGIDTRTHVVGSRKADEDAAMVRLLALYPPEQAKLVEQELDPNAPWTIYSVEGNEEAARLISIIYTIREADALAEARQETRGGSDDGQPPQTAELRKK